MDEDRQRSREIQQVRRAEQRRGKRPADPEAAELRKRLDHNARELLELNLDEFLRALKEDYKLSEPQLASAKAFWLQSRGG